MEATKSPVQCAIPSRKHYISHPIGITGFNLGSTAISDKAPGCAPELRVELVISGHDRFQAIERFREQIHQSLGKQAVWHSNDGVEMHRIYVRNGANFANESDWPEHWAWLKQNLEKFQQVFVPIIIKLDHSAFKK